MKKPGSGRAFLFDLIDRVDPMVNEVNEANKVRFGF